MHSDIYYISIGLTGMLNTLDIRYLWIFVALVLVRHIYLYLSKDSTNILSVVMIIVLGMLSAGSILLSFKVYYLHKFNIDSVQLKLNLYIYRIWKPEEVKKYLLDTLLEKTKNTRPIESSITITVKQFQIY